LSGGCGFALLIGMNSWLQVLCIWLSMILTIGMTNSASAIVDGPTTRGAADMAGVSAADALKIRQNAVRFIAVDRGGVATPFCSGVLSGGGEALSAAHCFSDSLIAAALSEGRIYAEVYDSNARPKFKKRVKVSRVESRKDENADLAVVELMGELPSTPKIPLALAGCDEGSTFVFGGFGKTEKNQMSKDVRLSRYQEMTEQDLTADPFHFYNQATMNNYAREWILLSKTGVGHICVGDSGSPLFCQSRGRLAIAGITASMGDARKSSTQGLKLEWGESCEKNFSAAVVTRLSANIPVLQGLRARLHATEDVFAETNSTKQNVLSDW
jgi:secreted trypsin-like serine protease